MKIFVVTIKFFNGVNGEDYSYHLVAARNADSAMRKAEKTIICDRDGVVCDCQETRARVLNRRKWTEMAF